MKKLLFLLFIAVIIETSPAVAEEVKGTVKSVNAATNEIVVSQLSGSAITVVIPSRVTKQLKIGSAVKVTTKKSSNVAEFVEMEVI